jgi:hypothetical protein
MHVARQADILHSLPVSERQEGYASAMNEATQFRAFPLGTAVRIEAGPGVEENPATTPEVFFQFDAETAERLARELTDAAVEARGPDAEPGPTSYGIGTRDDLE